MRPRKIHEAKTAELRKLMKELGLSCVFEVFATDTVRGRTCYKNKNLTVPLWAIQDKREGYATYYLCHELAHTIAPAVRGNHHGPEFQKAFMSICPKQYQHYELEYKPRLAKAAGVKQLT